MTAFHWRRLPTTSLEALTTHRFPAPHGFTGRFRTRGPASLPFGDRATRLGDLAALARAAKARTLREMRQVHAARVLVVHAGEPPWPTPPEADGVVVTTPGAGLVIKTADCVPVLLHDPETGAVGGAHAGWRGTAAGVTGATIRALAEATGSNPARFTAAIGPAIGPCCYEVGPDLLTAFEAGGHDPAPFSNPGPRGRPHLDLLRANRVQLEAARLRPGNILVANRCTRCDPAFHSYRRAGAPTGSNFAYAIASDGPLRSRSPRERRPPSRTG